MRAVLSDWGGHPDPCGGRAAACCAARSGAPLTVRERPVHQSFVNYRSFRYATIAAFISAATLLAYLLDHPRVPPSGGTWLGYTLGTVAALLVVFLSSFGILKRAFHSGVGTAIGWVSAHVYLGLAALVVATLHSGMRFGFNVHTLAYMLMCLLTGSGLWGMYACIRYPSVMSAPRGSQERRQTLRQVAELDERSLELAAITGATQRLISESIRRTDLGGQRPWRALRGRDDSAVMVGGESAYRPARLLANPGHQTLMQILAQMRHGSSDPELRARLQTLLEIAEQKSVLLERLRRETRLTILLRIWLYIHVPVCCALLAALVAHVLTVFFYR
jgi:hypothetical protein